MFTPTHSTFLKLDFCTRKYGILHIIIKSFTSSTATNYDKTCNSMIAFAIDKNTRKHTSQRHCIDIHIFQEVKITVRYSRSRNQYGKDSTATEMLFQESIYFSYFFLPIQQ